MMKISIIVYCLAWSCPIPSKVVLNRTPWRKRQSLKYKSAIQSKSATLSLTPRPKRNFVVLMRLCLWMATFHRWVLQGHQKMWLWKTRDALTLQWQSVQQRRRQRGQSLRKQLRRRKRAKERAREKAKKESAKQREECAKQGAKDAKHVVQKHLQPKQRERQRQPRSKAHRKMLSLANMISSWSVILKALVHVKFTCFVSLQTCDDTKQETMFKIV